QPCIGVFKARYDSIAPGMHIVRYPSLPHRLCETASHPHVCFALFVPEAREAAHVQKACRHVQKACREGVRLGWERSISRQEKGKECCLELRKLVLDRLPHVDVLKRRAVRHLCLLCLFLHIGKRMSSQITNTQRNRRTARSVVNSVEAEHTAWMPVLNLSNHC